MPQLPEGSATHQSIQAVIHKIADEWYDSILYGVANLQRNISAEGVWEKYADLLNAAFQLLTRLKSAVHKPLSAHAEATESVQSSGTCLQNGTSGVNLPRVLFGAAEYVQMARLTAFGDRCMRFPSPAPRSTGGAHLPELKFKSSDFFLELSKIAPGHHGWLHVYDRDLERWLRVGHKFKLTYFSRSNGLVHFGAYTAIVFHDGDMFGPEFLRLRRSLRETVVTYYSGTPKGSPGFHETERDFAYSHKVISCFLLQCIESPMAAPSRFAGHPAINQSVGPRLKGTVRPWPILCTWPPRSEQSEPKYKPIVPALLKRAAKAEDTATSGFASIAAIPSHQDSAQAQATGNATENLNISPPPRPQNPAPNHLALPPGSYGFPGPLSSIHTTGLHVLYTSKGSSQPRVETKPRRSTISFGSTTGLNPADVFQTGLPHVVGSQHGSSSATRDQQTGTQTQLMDPPNPSKSAV